MKYKLQIKFLDSRIGNEFDCPKYATIGSAGIDLSACIDSPIQIPSKEALLIKTGIAIHISHPGIAGIVLPRSGLAHKFGITLSNSVGLIDSDYQGEILVSCLNRGKNAYTVFPGDRIAQLILIPVYQAQLEVVSEFKESARGRGGFGHTGIGSDIKDSN